MRRERLCPHSASNGGCKSSRAAVHNHISLAVAAHEIAPAQDVERGRPAMRVEWNGLARCDSGVEHANSFVFEQENVMPWRSDQSIKLLCIFLFVYVFVLI
jgi:hypothetical protein